MGDGRMKTKVLIIDDEASLGQMLKINLEQTSQYEVDAVTSAAQGYEKVEQKNYDVIFLDILMPKVEGHEALKVIRQMTETPVIIMSAYIPPPAKAAIVEAGAYACLEKPVDISQLIEVIEKLKK